jgi:predicted SprT family Zn-dependent metalloprotease
LFQTTTTSKKKLQEKKLKNKRNLPLTNIVKHNVCKVMLVGWWLGRRTGGEKPEGRRWSLVLVRMREVTPGHAGCGWSRNTSLATKSKLRGGMAPETINREVLAGREQP